ncbi:hypothetical protein ACS0TY_022342 [Phlomoides rotata]
MAALKFFVFTLFLSLIDAHIRVESDASISDVADEVKLAGSDDLDSSILDQLQSKIHSLESHIEEKSREIKEKDQAIASKENIIKEKSGNIVSLETEIASYKAK